MTEGKKPYQKWQLIFIDSFTQKIFDRKKYTVKDKEELQSIIEDIHEHFKRVKIDPDTVEIKAKFIKYIGVRNA